MMKMNPFDLLFEPIPRKRYGHYDDLIRVTDAAKIYGCTRQNIHALIRRGRLFRYVVNGVLYVRECEVRAFAEATISRGIPRGSKLRTSKAQK